jgi:hypothetical protein
MEDKAVGPSPMQAPPTLSAQPLLQPRWCGYCCRNHADDFVQQTEPKPEFINIASGGLGILGSAAENSFKGVLVFAVIIFPMIIWHRMSPRYCPKSRVLGNSLQVM